MPQWEPNERSGKDYVPLFHREYRIGEEDILPEPNPYAAFGWLSPTGQLYGCAWATIIGYRR